MTSRTFTNTWLGTLGSAGGEPPETAAFPDFIGPYKVEALVGRGGMAAVYRCRDEGGEPVAVKWLHQPSEPIARRFALEVKALGRIQHKGVVRYLGHGVHQNRAYLVMEFLEGEDLRLWARRLRRLPSAERYERIRKLAMALAGSLSAVHEVGLVHRDVKPSNIRVLENDHPVLTDFGVVKDLADEGHTAMGVVVGTLNYAAPEQLQAGEVDARTDLYGLGCTLYTVLTDRHPFDASDVGELVQAHLTRPPVPPSTWEPTVPAGMERPVLRLMEKRPQDRFSSAASLAEALADSRTEGRPGVPLAGRREALDLGGQALERVASGEGCLLQVNGAPGTGRSWYLRTMEQWAQRRALPVVTPTEQTGLSKAMARLADGEAVLVCTDLQVPEPDLVVNLRPLRRADVRRSVVAAAGKAGAPAQIAERLYQATGGLPALLVPCLEKLAEDPFALDAGLPEVPVDRWLEQLDLDAMEILQALAAASRPVEAAILEAATQVPPEEPLEQMVELGLVKALGRGDGAGAMTGVTRFQPTATIFAQAALATAHDPKGLKARLERALAAQGEEPAGGARWAGWEERFADMVRLRHQGRLMAASGLARLLGGEAQAREAPDRVARVDTEAALLAWWQGDPKEAERLLLAATEVDGAAAQAWLALGEIALAEGRQPRAEKNFADALSRAERSSSLALELTSRMRLLEARALGGRAGPALAESGELLSLANGLGDAWLECRSLLGHGQLLLDLGLPGEAARALADVSALSNAADLPRERWQAHVLRAQGTLDHKPGSLIDARSAMERLLRILGEEPPPDPEGFRALAHALRARAAALLGDRRTAGKASDLSKGLMVKGSPAGVRARLHLSEVMASMGRMDEAAALREVAAQDAGRAGFTLLSWLAHRRDKEGCLSPADLLAGAPPRWEEQIRAAWAGSGGGGGGGP